MTLIYNSRTHHKLEGGGRGEYSRLESGNVGGAQASLLSERSRPARLNRGGRRDKQQDLELVVCSSSGLYTVEILTLLISIARQLKPFFPILMEGPSDPQSASFPSWSIEDEARNLDGRIFGKDNGTHVLEHLYLANLVGAGLELITDFVRMINTNVPGIVPERDGDIQADLSRYCNMSTHHPPFAS